MHYESFIVLVVSKLTYIANRLQFSIGPSAQAFYYVRRLMLSMLSIARLYFSDRVSKKYAKPNHKVGGILHSESQPSNFFKRKRLFLALWLKPPDPPFVRPLYRIRLFRLTITSYFVCLQT